MVENLPEMQETWVRSKGWEIPWRREWLPTPAFLPGESPEQRSKLQSMGLQSRTQLNTHTHTHTHTHAHMHTHTYILYSLDGRSH